MIANSGSDENGRYKGGKAGDQTGTEWNIRSWYNRPWNCVLHHPDPAVRSDIALLATHAANNDLIGYDQDERWTFWNALKAAKDYDPINIAVACEGDCSAGVAAIVKAVGYRKGIDALRNVNQNMTTHNMRAALEAAGFQVLTDAKYRESDKDIWAGDILLNDAHHVCINVTDGVNIVHEVKPKQLIRVAVPSGRYPVYRAYAPGDRLLTSSRAEIDSLPDNWDDEGVAWYGADSGLPLYRLVAHEHFYTADYDEALALQELGWVIEDVNFASARADDPQASPICRLYNPNEGNHHWTMDEAEADALVKLGWRNEGIKFYGYAA